MEDRVYVIKRDDGWYMANFDDEDENKKKVYWSEKLRDADFYSARMVIEADYNDLPEKERKQSRIVEVKLFDDNPKSLFKIGDKVITSDGRKGVIVNICNCEYCQRRGFLDSEVIFEDGNDGTIDNIDFENGFRDYYSIGDTIYGNLEDITQLNKWIERFKSNING